MKIKIIILTAIIALIPKIVQAEDFILPNSFSLEEQAMPDIKINEKEKKPVKVRNHKYNPEKTVKTDVSLTKFVKNYKYNYSQTLNSTIIALTEFNIEPLCYDSSRGHIKARLNTGKELFIMLLPSTEKMTHVRITPADGQYNISMDLIGDIFTNIERNLYSSVN